MSQEETDDEGFRHIVRGWPAIAYVAWDGYLEHGPGAVFVVENETGPPWLGKIHYAPLEILEDETTADLKESLMIALVAYEPTEQVVLIFQDQYRLMRVMTLSGEMSPPEAHSSRIIH